jgi:hypothetical protein
MIFEDIIKFLRKPYYEEKVFSVNKSALKNLFWSFLFLCISICCVLILLKIIDDIVVRIFHYRSIKSDLNNFLKTVLRKNIIYSIMAFTIMPFFEELAFRLPLIPKKKYLLLSAIIILYFSFGGKYNSLSAFQNIYCLALFCFCILTVIFLYFLINEEKLITFINAHYTLYFYYVCVVFGLTHLYNAGEHIQWSIFYLYPLFVTPQIIAGFMLGYLRNTQHFIYGLLLHMTMNFISVSPTLL